MSQVTLGPKLWSAFLCFIKLLADANDLPQIWQRCFLISSWTPLCKRLVCLLSSHFIENILSQTGHLCGMKCARKICCLNFRYPNHPEKNFPHISHLIRLSSLMPSILLNATCDFFLCFTNSSRFRNTDLHSRQFTSPFAEKCRAMCLLKKC